MDCLAFNDLWVDDDNDGITLNDLANSDEKSFFEKNF